tara:strand:- start:175 stop:330 length:156 start_codon:yes stop_codon:yes gene_type:complete
MGDDQYLIDDEFRDVTETVTSQGGASISDDDGRIIMDLGDITDIDFFGEDE